MLKLLGDAQASTLPALCILPDQHVQIISEATGASTLSVGATYMYVATAGQLLTTGSLAQLSFSSSVKIWSRALA